MYPYNYKGQKIQTDSDSIMLNRGFIVLFQVSAANAVAADTDAIIAGIAASAADPVVTSEGFTNPGAARNITATTRGTAGDVKAVQVIVEGTNMNNEPITETLPVFTVDTLGTVSGSKAFKTITKVTVPAMDGAGALVDIGFGEKLGIPYKLAHNTVLKTFLDNAPEGTAPTVTVDSANLEGNTIDLNSALSGKVVDAYLIV